MSPGAVYCCCGQCSNPRCRCACPHTHVVCCGVIQPGPLKLKDLLTNAFLYAGLMTLHSPVSGSTLTAPDSVKCTAVKDPITGTTLTTDSGFAQVTAPVMEQPLRFARSFYLRKDIDITIQQIRSTNKVNRHTNEKIGTAGSPTGLDRTLVKH